MGIFVFVPFLPGLGCWGWDGSGKLIILVEGFVLGKRGCHYEA